MLKKIYRFFIYLFISSLIYVIIIKLVEPPITITQLTNAFGLGLKRDYVSWNEMSYNIKLAALASEDQSFTDHSGFDWDAIEKSLRPKKKKKKSKIPIGGGASTITQQTAKNVFLWQGRSYLRKGLEAWFTLLIEFFWNKERIMEVYLNSIEMGNGIYGAEAASQFWFKKSASNLSKDEAAAIAAILPSPLNYKANPANNYIQKRKAWVKQQMNYWSNKLDYNKYTTDISTKTN